MYVLETNLRGNSSVKTDEERLNARALAFRGAFGCRWCIGTVMGMHGNAREHTSLSGGEALGSHSPPSPPPTPPPPPPYPFTPLPAPFPRSSCVQVKRLIYIYIAKARHMVVIGAVEAEPHI